MRLFDKFKPVWNAEGGAGAAGGDAGAQGAGGGQDGQQQQQQQASQLPAWISPELPPETREFLSKAEYGKADKPDAALIHLQQLAKVQANPTGYLPLPKGADDAEGQAAVFKALGMPEAPGKYEVKLPDNYKADPEMIELAKSLAHQLGADNTRAQKLVDGYIAFETKRVEQINTENAKAMTQLEAEFGAGLAEAQVAGRKAMEALKVPAETLAFFDANKGSVHIARLLAMIGKGMGEGSDFAGGGANNASASERAMAALTSFQESQEYKDVTAQGPRHPKYREVMDRLDELGKAAYPARRS
jgi:hypothetical protein